MTRPMCSVDGCVNKRDSHGLCSAHVYRLRRHGDVMADKPIGWRLALVHGTYDGYHNHGCRCADCTRANTDYYRDRNHRTGRNRPRAEVDAERRAIAEARDNHGTETRYTSLGCRCDDCRRAATDASRRRRTKVAA